MFEIRLMIEDKNVPKVLWALDGLLVGMPQILPVRAAAAKAGKVVSTQPLPGGNLIQQVRHYLMEWPEPTIAWDDFVDLMTKTGVAKNSKGYITHGLKEMKAIKYHGGGHRKPIYKILKPSTEA